MENRAYTFIFLAVLAIVCVGAYVAVSALVDSSADPIIKVGETSVPTRVALASRNPTAASGTRTPTPTNTPFVLVIPTIIFPTVTPTPLPPTPTPTLPPFPSPRPLPTRTRTPTPTEATTATPTGLPPTAAPSNTPTINPGSFQFVPASAPSVDTKRQCVGQYYIYGLVRDAQNQPLAGVRVRFATTTVFPAPALSEAKGYELTVGTGDTDWFITIVDANNKPLSQSVTVRTSGLQSGNCWYQLNWRRVN